MVELNQLASTHSDCGSSRLVGRFDHHGPMPQRISWAEGFSDIFNNSDVFDPYPLYRNYGEGG